MFKTVFLYLLLMTGSAGLYAQGKISGTIADSASRSGIAYASIRLLSLPDSGLVRGGQSDSAGLFVLTGIADGHYVLQLTSLGYGRQLRVIAMTGPGRDIALGTIGLAADRQMLGAVVVSGERRALQYRDGKMILQVAGNSFYKTASSTLDILSKTPGLTVNPDGTMVMQGRNTPTLFVDGRPATMSPEEQLAWLNGLTPEQVESIEIITNPSSRYDGQYKGIIDVRLRKQGLGWKGNFSTLLRQNKYFLTDNSLNLTLATSRLVYGLRLGYVIGDDPYRYQALQQLASKQWMTTFTDTRTRQDNVNVQASVDYQVKKDQVIGLTWKTWYANRQRYRHNDLAFADSLRKGLTDASRSITEADPLQRNHSVNLSYDATFGKHRLNIFGAYSIVQNRQQEDIQNYHGITGTLQSYWKTALQNDIRLRTVQADYSMPWLQGTVEAGGKFAYITTNNDLRYDTLTRTNEFKIDTARTNLFLYDEYISAGYLVYGRQSKRIGFKISLRVEHTHTRADAVTTQELRKRDYLTWLPGANISYAIGANESIGLAVTRRITRPGFELLNPFRFYYSPLNYWVGNPYLQASTTTQLTLTYTNKELRVSAVAGRENDRMIRYPEYKPETNELLYLGANQPYNDFANLELAYSLTVARWWKSVYNGGVYYNKEQMPYFGTIFSNPVIDFTINTSQVFSLPHGLTADLAWRYQSWTGNSLYYIKPSGAVDLGLQKSWFNGALSTKFNFYDLLNHSITRLRFRREEIINNRFSHRFYAQRAALSIHYNFGKARTRARQVRTTDEEKRVSN